MQNMPEFMQKTNLFAYRLALRKRQLEQIQLELSYYQRISNPEKNMFNSKGSRAV